MSSDFPGQFRRKPPARNGFGIVVPILATDELLRWGLSLEAIIRQASSALEHDVFRRKHIMLLSYYYRMLFCEKPDSTFSQHALGLALYGAGAKLRQHHLSRKPHHNSPQSKEGAALLSNVRAFFRRSGYRFFERKFGKSRAWSGRSHSVRSATALAPCFTAPRW